MAISMFFISKGIVFVRSREMGAVKEAAHPSKLQDEIVQAVSRKPLLPLRHALSISPLRKP